MIIKNKNNLYFFLVFSIFVLTAPFIRITTVSPVDDFDVSRFLGFNPQKLSSSAPKTSGYYNLSGSPIIIDDADPNYNWSKTAAENPWCSGSGTINDPYIIENVYSDGEMNIAETPGKPHSANCLSIYSSTAYFIVRGCYFTKSGTGEFNSGIYLAYTENGIIYNNTFIYHHQAVFVNLFSHNNTIFYNSIEHNHDIYGPGKAMQIDYSDNCTVVKNLMVNTYVGIQLFQSIGTEIKQNLINSTLFGYPVNVGIDFMFINDSIIMFNVFAGDYTGTTFAVSQIGSSGNTIQNNTISGTIPADLGTPPPPQASSDYTDLIKLASSYNNEVKHNVAYVPGHVNVDPGIPSYNVIVVLGAIGIVTVFLVAKTRNKNKTNN